MTEIVQFLDTLKINKRRVAARTALFEALLTFAEAGGTLGQVRESIKQAFFEVEALHEDAEIVPLREPRS